MNTNVTPDVAAYPNATAVHAGPLDGLWQYSVRHAASQDSLHGKLWLKEMLGLTGMEISFGIMKPGQEISFIHAHRQNEELYLIVRGEGELWVDGQVIPVREGSAVRISPEGARCWRNTGAVDMVYFVIQAKERSLEQWTFTDGRMVAGQSAWKQTATAA